MGDYASSPQERYRWKFLSAVASLLHSSQTLTSAGASWAKPPTAK